MSDGPTQSAQAGAGDCIRFIDPVGRPSERTDMREVQHPLADRLATIFVTAVPPALLAAGIVFSWGSILHLSDLVAFVIMYLLTGVGIAVGFHRLFTHRSFKTRRPLRAALAVLGSAAAEGPVIEWVATHRQHHTFSDEEGDPHSPHAGHSHGFLGSVRGLLHAHIGWMFGDPERSDESRYAPDLTADPLVSFISRTFVLWTALGIAIPFGIGVALTGTVAGGLTAALWGGAVRIFCFHHATFSINSLCHFFGPQPYKTGDQSRNLAWLAIPTLGESWHNNHHAFPTSARHGLGSRQIDPAGGIIGLLEKAGLAWDGVRNDPDRLALRARPAED